MISVIVGQNARLVTAIASFGLVLGLWLAVVLIWRIKKTKHTVRVQKRLGLVKELPTRVLRLWHGAQESTVRVPGLPTRLGPLKRLDNLRKDAGWKIPASSLLPAVTATSGLVFVIVLAISNHLLAGVAGFVSTLLVAWAYLKHCVAKRMELFDQQFTDALDLARRSLRAGHPLIGALQLVAEEIEEPVGPIFDSICQQQMMGISLEEAIHAVGTSSSNEDMKLFSASLAMQMRSGGDMAHLMERLAAVIRERIRLNHRVRILTAQTQFGKRILVALPFVLLVVLSVLNPKYIDPLFTSGPGQIMLAFAGISVLLGMWVMNRMAVLKY